MWVITGGCHYTGDCERYLHGCGACPQLGSSMANDLSSSLWQRKAQAWASQPMTLVAVSHWIAECARRNPFLAQKPIHVIPNAIDAEQFRPQPKALARQQLNLPSETKLLLFGAVSATSPYKGFKPLVQALNHLAHDASDAPAHADPKFQMVVFGNSQPHLDQDIPFPVTHMGYINDNAKLATLYSAADIMIVPSLQDAFPKTPIEALACGTPVVCFDTSGLRDAIEHLQCGYRAELGNPKDLADGIRWVLADQTRYAQLAQRGREKVEQQFTLRRVAQQYRMVYSEVLATASSRN
jgi:glycosyltransferase involved in cell wall biosynthesis